MDDNLKWGEGSRIPTSLWTLCLAGFDAGVDAGSSGIYGSAFLGYFDIFDWF
jgi:hypothetical protein